MRTPRPQTRRLDRVNVTLAGALKQMRKGAALHYQLTKSGPLWQLSNGTKLTPEIARSITADPNVVAVNHALFRGSPPQTWVFAWTE